MWVCRRRRIRVQDRVASPRPFAPCFPSGPRVAGSIGPGVGAMSPQERCVDRSLAALK